MTKLTKLTEPPKELKMTKIDTEVLKGKIDFFALANQFTTLSGRGKEQYGPCPKCQGDDRLHVTPDWFFCRRCHPERGDCIEFIQWLKGLDFKTACEWLSNGNLSILAGSSAAKRVARSRTRLTPPPDQWRTRAFEFVKDAKEQL